MFFESHTLLGHQLIPCHPVKPSPIGSEMEPTGGQIGSVFAGYVVCEIQAGCALSFEYDLGPLVNHSRFSANGGLGEVWWYCMTGQPLAI